MTGFPAHLIKDNFDDYLARGGKVRITEEQEQLILQVFTFIFKHFVAGNLPGYILTFWVALMSKFGMSQDCSQVEQFFSLLAAALKNWGITGEVINKLEELAHDPDNPVDDAFVETFKKVVVHYREKTL